MPVPTRRQFLGTAAALALAGRTSRADEPRAPASDSIVLGFIGVGGMGTGLLNIFKGFGDARVAAVCDVHEPHAQRAKEAAGGSPDDCKDFREVLDRKDIDAVVIATPDHWHAIPTILACQAGKDVYCEKPLTFRIGEGQRVVEAARKHGRITQMGNLIHAGESYHRMAEIVQSGVLGRISKVRCWMSRNIPGLGRPADTAPPAGCDYDFWLGPAPSRPFNPNRFTFNWRYFWDYAGGHLCDFVCHLVDPVHWGMKVQYPRTAVASGERILDDNAETPDTLEVAYHYDEGFDLVWSHQETNARGFEGRPAGIAFYGTRGTLHGHYNDYAIVAEKGEEIVEPPKTLPRSPGHHREWLSAIKSREACSCNFEYGHQLSTVGHLGNVALWSGRKVEWDASRGRFTDPALDRYLLRDEYRSPWSLPDV
jgi:predicted dehydrogenase